MEDYFKELDTAIYQASFSITETNAAGGNLILNLNANNGTRLLITNVIIILTTAAGNRSLYLNIQDKDDNFMGYIARGLSMSANASFIFPHTGNLQANNSSAQQTISLVNGDGIKVFFSVGQNESYDVYVRGYVRGKLPVASTSGSTGTPSLTTNYARIV